MQKSEKFILLLEKVKAAGRLTDTEVAVLLDVTPTYISKIRTGVSRASKRLTAALERIHDGESKPIVPNAKPADHQSNWHKVPVISFARAGAFIDYQDLIHHLEEWIESDSRDPEAYGVILEGDSMEPRFVAGDRVVVNPNAEARNGDFVVARLRDPEGVVFKRFYITGKNGADVRLESLNPIYEPIVRPRSDFEKIQPVVQFFGRVRG